jgi:HlyD family secretion protein
VRHAALALLLASAVACAREDDGALQGYVEGESVWIAAPLGGELEELQAVEGATVAAGAPLFALDPQPQALAMEETEQRMAQARARLADLEKGGRPSELAALEARLASARAGLEHAERDLARRQELRDSGHTDAVSEEELDRYRTDRDVRRADAAALEAELETARLGGRADALEAARRDVDALAAQLAQLRWQVEEKRRAAPAAGLVQETLYRVGEYVAAGRPVVALLPPENVIVRFYVPQARLSALAPGDTVDVHADGLAPGATARVRFVSSEAEFTPPVIYSKETRAKLVFLVEAVPDAASVARLRPGQPLEVRLR